MKVSLNPFLIRARCRREAGVNDDAKNQRLNPFLIRARCRSGKTRKHPKLEGWS